MFSVYKRERDAEGREVIEIGMDVKRSKAMRMAVPVVFPALASIASGSTLRVMLDSKAGTLLVETASGQTEIRMADLAKAEFGSRISTRTDADNNIRETTVYRLEFVKKNGERVPATAGHSNAHSLADQEQLVAAIDAALKRQMV